MMKANEIRKMSAAEREAKLVELKKDLFIHPFDSQPENRRMPPRAASKMSNFFISMTDWLVSLQKYEIF